MDGERHLLHWWSNSIEIFILDSKHFEFTWYHKWFFTVVRIIIGIWVLYCATLRGNSIIIRLNVTTTDWFHFGRFGRWKLKNHFDWFTELPRQANGNDWLKMKMKSFRMTIIALNIQFACDISRCMNLWHFDFVNEFNGIRTWTCIVHRMLMITMDKIVRYVTIYIQ